MKQKNYIVYHDSCLDGFLAGFITHYKAIYEGVPNIVMVALNYNDKDIEEFASKVNATDTLTVVDFSFNNAIRSDNRLKVLLEVKETDKLGMGQIQEDICKNK